MCLWKRFLAMYCSSLLSRKRVSTTRCLAADYSVTILKCILRRGINWANVAQNVVWCQVVLNVTVNQGYLFQLTTCTYHNRFFWVISVDGQVPEIRNVGNTQFLRLLFLFLLLPLGAYGIRETLRFTWSDKFNENGNECSRSIKERHFLTS
jgi:hypothetical protein